MVSHHKILYAAVDIEEDNIRVFILGIAEGDFYKINSTILGLQHDLRLWKEMPLSPRTFMAYRDISIFRRIDSLITEAIVIGGSEVNSIPLQDFEKLFIAIKQIKKQTDGQREKEEGRRKRRKMEEKEKG